MPEKQMICPRAETCKDNNDCPHVKPHYENLYCSTACEGENCPCVPYVEAKKPAGTSNPERGVGIHDDRVPANFESSLCPGEDLRDCGKPKAPKDIKGIQKSKLQELVNKINGCTDQECKGILLFVTGYMSEKIDWDIYTDALEHGIRANTWERKEKVNGH